eukprot:scaffold198606_cov24-Prasinocladus_malaysianus.AAC.2
MDGWMNDTLRPKFTGIGTSAVRYDDLYARLREHLSVSLVGQVERVALGRVAWVEAGSGGLGNAASNLGLRTKLHLLCYFNAWRGSTVHRIRDV